MKRRSLSSTPNAGGMGTWNMFRWAVSALALVSTVTIAAVFHAPAAPNDMRGGHLRPHSRVSSTSSRPASPKNIAPTKRGFATAIGGSTPPKSNPGRQYLRGLKEGGGLRIRPGGGGSNNIRDGDDKRSSSTTSDYGGKNPEKPTPLDGGGDGGSDESDFEEGRGENSYLVLEDAASTANARAVDTEELILKIFADLGGADGGGGDKNSGGAVGAAAEKAPLTQAGEVANEEVLAHQALMDEVSHRKIKRPFKHQ